MSDIVVGTVSPSWWKVMNDHYRVYSDGKSELICQSKQRLRKRIYFYISEPMKTKFAADHSELVLLDFLHIPPSGD